MKNLIDRLMIILFILYSSIYHYIKVCTRLQVFFVSGIYLLNIIHSTMLNNQAVFHEMHILKPQLNSLYLT